MAYLVTLGGCLRVLLVSIPTSPKVANAALNGEAASDYKQIKDAILRQYNINAETYRQKFLGITICSTETYQLMRVNF